ncbi:hypothetical protein EMIHUDRAFT_233079, partial [Emiliania huxleyi CCMP1516]|uniref:DhaK domain-containing protein n=2 Tax=Emiliania huxleyi TaxID=2903 RepID=A0A0D3K3C8_EMIH1
MVSDVAVQSILNNTADAVEEMIEGLVLLNPSLKRLGGHNVVVRASLDRSKVALVSGGGSGHEPSHAGWVGEGMLSAAVCGAVFASPSTAAVLAAILHVTGPAGCLVVVKNYTGDRLNFGLACEHAKALGLSVELVVSILNNTADAVEEMIEGLVLLNPSLKRLGGHNVVVRASLDRSKVALVSGGGSGHEPSHAGWVGEGMLSAAVCGAVFASPSTAAVLAAILHVTGPAGCLVVVKNYTGDRLNFGLACEHAKALGLSVELVV